MYLETETTKRGWIFLLFAFLAFGILGLEMILAFIIEPIIYGYGLDDFNQLESIIHWISICLIWGICAMLLIRFAKHKYNFDLFAHHDKISYLVWLLCGLILLFSIIISIIDWNGFKPIKEYRYNGWQKFIFQYIYYFVETILVYLIIAFGQEAGEKLFKAKKIPYGGILTALTWGMIHWLTKGDIVIALLSLLGAILYGVVYLLTKKNVYIAFPLIFLMFIL